MQSGTINTPSRARFQRVLEERLRLSPGKVVDIITHKAKSVAVRLYAETKKVAPSDAKIKQDVLSRDWKVRRKAGAWPLREGEKRGSDGPLNRMRASVIGRRQKARGSVAAGWLPAVRRLGGREGGKKLAQVKNPKGTVAITGAGTSRFIIMIANSMPGVAKVETKHQILRKALNAETQDTLNYIRTKRAGGSGTAVGGNR